MTFQGTNFKPSRTARKKATLKTRSERKTHEDAQKAIVRKRDGYKCRFPICGCGRLKLPLESSHQVHKGMGSKDGVSTSFGMVLLCNHRHQYGRVSRHAGTMRAVYLDPENGYDGPVTWQINREGIPLELRHDHALPKGEWITVATETQPGQIARPSAWQLVLLKLLGEMDM